VVNADAPAAMAQAPPRGLGIPFLHISTDYVFDGSGDPALGPTDPTGPLGAYGRRSLTGETGHRRRRRAMG
jgi:dTDP-4-dehydrorhamnose reductase